MELIKPDVCRRPGHAAAIAVTGRGGVQCWQFALPLYI